MWVNKTKCVSFKRNIIENSRNPLTASSSHISGILVGTNVFPLNKIFTAYLPYSVGYELLVGTPFPLIQ